MARRLRWIGQAQAVFESCLPQDLVDLQQPDLASVKFTAQLIGILMASSTRVGDPLPIMNDERTVRVWFAATAAQATGWAIEVSYDGGRTFEDPLARYRDFVLSDNDENAGPTPPVPGLS